MSVSVETMRAREPLLSVRDVADYLAVTPAWVYEHAAELGVERLGAGPRARLRFKLSEVDEYLTTCSASRKSEPANRAPQAELRPRRRRALGTSAPLLPIRGRIAAETRASS